MGHPLSGNRETWLAPNVPLAPVLPPHASRSTPHAAARRGPAGSGREHTLPHWLLPDTNRRFVKERTGPDLDEHPLYFSMSQNRAIRADKSIRFSPRRRGTIVVMAKKTLNESDVQNFYGRSPVGAPGRVAGGHFRRAQPSQFAHGCAPTGERL